MLLKNVVSMGNTNLHQIAKLQIGRLVDETGEWKLSSICGCTGFSNFIESSPISSVVPKKTVESHNALRDIFWGKYSKKKVSTLVASHIFWRGI